MLDRLTRSLAAAILSIAVALTGMTATATRAHADSEDAAAVIAGIIALYAIGRAIDNRNDRNEQPQVGRHPHRPGDGYWPDRGHDDRYDRHRGARVIPAACYREFTTRQGHARGYLARCMQDNVRRPGLLPPECVMRIETGQGTRFLYDGRCLARAGWEQEVRNRR